MIDFNEAETLNYADHINLTPVLKRGTTPPVWDLTTNHTYIFNAGEYMEADLKNLLQWPVNSILEGFSVGINFKLLDFPDTTPGTIATMEGKRKLTLRVNSEYNMELMYKLNDVENTIEVVGAIPYNVTQTAVFGFITNKMDPSKNVVFLSTS